MPSFERRGRHESLDKSIAAIAFAYGFSSAPVPVSRKTVASMPHIAPQAAAALAVLKGAQAAAKPAQVWGSAKSGSGSTVVFGTLGTKAAIGNALIVKTALSVAESAGFRELSVLVSSVGDAESKKRFTRELGNFFKKNAEAVPAHLKGKAVSDPDAVYRELLASRDPLIERAPRTIDYLSENSRKVMLETLSLFESVGIPYAIDPRMHGEAGLQAELVFAIEAVQKDGSRVRVAQGGRYDEAARKHLGIASDSPTAISISLPRSVDLDAPERAPSCFVVHVGDAAKLRAFTLLEALWRAHVAVTQVLMADNFRDQIEQGKVSGAKYLAIIGQREALDNTIIVRNTATQIQVTLPMEKLEGYLARVRH